MPPPQFKSSKVTSTCPSWMPSKLLSRLDTAEPRLFKTGCSRLRTTPSTVRRRLLTEPALPLWLPVRLFATQVCELCPSNPHGPINDPNMPLKVFSNPPARVPTLLSKPKTFKDNTLPSNPWTVDPRLLTKVCKLCVTPLV